jgi:ATP-dependent DNA helicase DinG
MTDFQALFGSEGALARGLEDFEPRPGQAAMATAVARALAGQGRLVAEAGTGTGKTLAYLIPALASGLKVIVSTGTKALQDQLFHKDLPLAAATLATPVRSTLLKGRANYLCLHRLDLAQHDRRLHRRDLRERVQAIREWSGRTTAGDLSEMGDTSDGSSIWPAVSSTTENCLRRRRMLSL